MKQTLTLISLLYCLSISGMSNATPFINATITQLGDEYSKISRLRTGNRTGWYTSSNGTIYTNWSRHWAEYTTFLTKGVWDVGLNVINNGNLGQNWYDTFKVRSSLSNEILNIQASDTELSYGLSSVDILSAGNYTVRYTWLNDKWGGRRDPLNRDANIQIQSAFFNLSSEYSANSVPAPSPFLLLPLGIVALFSSKRATRSINSISLSPRRG